MSAAAHPYRSPFLAGAVDLLDRKQTLDVIEKGILEHRQIKHVCINVAKLVAMRDDVLLKDDVLDSDIISADGMGVVWGARLLGIGVPARVTGIDLMLDLLDLCRTKGYRPYFLGASQEVLDKAVKEILRAYPGLTIAGYRNGYFSSMDEPQIVEAIRASNAQCLFVAISTPIKERFLNKYRHQLGVPFIMGIGGALDVVAGKVRRAPLWMQTMGLEWFYRLIQEPRRMWKRYLWTNMIFAGLVLRAWMRSRD